MDDEARDGDLEKVQAEWIEIAAKLRTTCRRTADILAAGHLPYSVDGLSALLDACHKTLALDHGARTMKKRVDDDLAKLYFDQD